MELSLRFFKFYRWCCGGTWVKTKKRGWITKEEHNDYLGYGFDPIAIKTVDY
jgi:hypothetical protein